MFFSMMVFAIYSPMPAPLSGPLEVKKAVNGYLLTTHPILTQAVTWHAGGCYIRDKGAIDHEQLR